LKIAGVCWAISYDPVQDRLLLTDPVLRAIHEVRILEGGLGKDKIIMKDPAFKRLTSILYQNNYVYVAVADSGLVYQINLQNAAKRVVAKSLSNPLSLYVSSDGRRLLIADAGRGVIVQAILAPGGSQRDIASNRELQTPNGVVIDRTGNIWIADESAMAVFKFSAGGVLSKTLRPGN
jgi:hypothetical protein